MVHSVISDKAHRVVPLVHAEASITVTNSERVKTFADAFESQFSLNLLDANIEKIIAKAKEELDIDFTYSPVAPFSEHGLCNITSDKLEGSIREQIW